MPPSVRLLLLAGLFSLAETPASAPVHGGRGGWTFNSAGYLLGPDGLAYSQSLLASRSLGETVAKAETGDPGVLSKKALKEEDALGS